MTLEHISRKTILVVEDEETILAALEVRLVREGYTVLTARDGVQGLAAARSEHPDLVLLDLMLPGLDGLEVCSALRKTSRVPVIILTARDEEVDRVLGLELGADDYVTKPFSMRELVARVRALLRRAAPQEVPTADPTAPQPTITSLDVVLSEEARRVWRNGQELALRPKEFELLSFLLRNRGRVLSREQLLTQVWGYDVVVDTRTVDVYIRWLREKLEDVPARPKRITTVRGIGYRFEG